MGADELREHLVEIVEHVFEKLALAAGLDEREGDAVEGVTIAQKEDGEDGDKEEHPDFLSRFGGADADALGEVGQILAMVVKEALDAGLGGGAPAVLGADAGGEVADGAGELSVGGLVHEAGEGFAETGALAADSGTGEDEEEADGEEKQKIDDGDGAGASANKFVEAADGGINQVGEEDGEKEEDQGAPGGVEEAEDEREQQEREDHARGS